VTSLSGQTVVVIGGSAGIGLETARLARADGADVILAARNEERLRQAADELGALSTAAFDATDEAALERFFADLPGPVDHVMVTAGSPFYSPLAEMDVDDARRYLGGLVQPLIIARLAKEKVRAGGSLVFVSGTGGKRPAIGLTVIGVATVALRSIVENLALEIAPIRVNLVAPGFVDTPLSARLLGDQLDARREELRTTLPIKRVVGPADVAALAVHLMANGAVTGASYDIDGGQQLLRG
jgi:NAD(P)-dependent dehydrogenase (short-subunit alcohol dehydrogenase family)